MNIVNKAYVLGRYIIDNILIAEMQNTVHTNESEQYLCVKTLNC